MYLRSLRLRRAQQLLGTEMPMGEVPLACGYVDQSHLIEQLTRAVATPRGAIVP